MNPRTPRLKPPNPDSVLVIASASSIPAKTRISVEIVCQRIAACRVRQPDCAARYEIAHQARCAKLHSRRGLRMRTVLRKLMFVDLIKGLRVTFRNQDPKELITEQY